jgi:hypothetical protein
VRQNFRGATVDHVLVGGGEEELALLESLHAQLGVQSRPIGADIGGAAALAAFGGILDRLAADGLDLLAVTRRPATHYDRVLPAARALAVVALVIAMGWAGAGALRARSEAAALDRARDEVATRMPQIWSMRSTLEQRAGYAARVAALEAADVGHGQLARVLEALATAITGPVHLTAVGATWSNNAWHVDVAGVASGRGGAEAVGSLTAFYDRIPRVLPVSDLALGSYDYMAADSLAPGAVRLSFRLRFSAFGDAP